MNSDFPEHLKATRDLLTQSLPSHPREIAPPVPQELMAEFADRFEAKQVVEAPTQVAMPWSAKVRRFFAAPSFGLAAAAVLVLGLLVPQLIDRSSQRPETFRGSASSPVADHVTQIVFVGKEKNYIAAVEDAQVFEPGALVKVDDLDSALLESDPKVVIDFEAGTLSVYGSDGTRTYREDLPKSPDDLPAAIAAALTQL